jgi:hypothetical protein
MEQLAINLDKALKDLEKKVAKVGWFKGARYNDKKQTPVAYVAAIHEFGYPSKNIPARPFLRPTLSNKKQEWKELAFKLSKLVLKGQKTADEMMETIGLKAVGDITKTIKNIWSPALKPSTINNRIRKYSSDPQLKESTRKIRKKEVQRFVSAGLYKPLEDTGHMIATITNVVESL